MKSLSTLLKVAQRRLDELGIEAAKVGQEVVALREREQAIRDRERHEIAAAGGNPMFASMLPAYRLKVRWQVDQIRHEIREKDKVLDEIRERLQAAYVEKSKFEQLIEQQRTRTEAERAAVEQAMLDEVAINRAGRK